MTDLENTVGASNPARKIANCVHRSIWILLVCIAVGYFIMTFLYGLGIGLGLGEDLSATTASRPKYMLKEFAKTNYTAAGLARATDSVDAVYVVRDTPAELDTEVNIYWHTLGMIVTLSIVYGIRVFFLAVDNKLYDEIMVYRVSSMLYSLTLVLVWNFVQPDIMYILGNNDKTAHWLVSCAIFAQVGLYYATEHNMIAAVGMNTDNGKGEAGNGKEASKGKPVMSIMGVSVTANGTITGLALIVGGYLFSIVVGLCILRPLSIETRSFDKIDEAYRIPIAIYLTHQFVEFFRFVSALVYPKITVTQGENGTQWLKTMFGMLVGPNFQAFLHVWVFMLVAVYAFLPSRLIYQAGKL